MDSNIFKDYINFWTKEYGPDVFKETMANVGEHVNYLGEYVEKGVDNSALKKWGTELKELGTESEEYWRKGQSDAWNEQSEKEKLVHNLVYDPVNALPLTKGRFIQKAISGVKKSAPLVSKNIANLLAGWNIHADGRETVQSFSSKDEAANTNNGE